MNFAKIAEQIWRPVELDLKISQKGLVLVLVPLLFGIIFFVSLGFLLSQAESDVWKESDARMVVTRVNGIGRHFINASQYLFRYTLAKTPELRDQFEQETEAIIADVEMIRELSIDHPWQIANVEKMEQLANDGLHMFESVLQAVEQPDKVGLTRKAVNYQKDITDLLDRLSYVARVLVEAEQEQLNKSVLSSSRTREFAVNWLYAAAVFNVFLVFSIAMLFSKGITQRLSTLVENSNRLAGSRQLLPPLEGKDEIAVVDHVFHDMAETLADLSRRERAVVDNAVDVICSVDANGRFLSVNQASFIAWGYEPDELVGQKISNLVVEDDRDRTISTIKEMIGSKESKFFENRILRKDESIVEALWSATWSAKEEAFFCVAHDITQRKEVERMKEEFLAMVSHDLRTPLTSIQFSLAIILEQSQGKLAQDILEELQAAERNADNLITMINRLLDVEKIESGKLDLDLAPMQVANLVNRARDAVAPFASRHGVAIDFTDTDLKTTADEDRLLQVLVNLLSNAIKFSPHGGRVTLAVKQEAEWLEFAVIDQGPGIPEDYKDAIFDRFQQVKMSKYKRKGGTGLGLAICRAIVLAHSGQIGVRSKEGEGSTFWFKIPYEDGPTQAEKPPTG
jgi:PAS domain S-box-containing protein